MKSDSMADEVMETVAKISPYLSGRHPDVVGAILADLVAMWLAGHQPRDGKTKDQALWARKELLTEWVGLAEKLIPVNEKIVHLAMENGATPYDEDKPLDSKPN